MSLPFFFLLLVCILPLGMTSIAKLGRFRLRDNRNPREWRKDLDGFRARAYAAQDNGFEALPLFIAGFFTSFSLRGEHTTLTLLAGLFVVARIAYGFCYLFDRPSLRSIVWMVGFGSSIALFFL